MAYMERLGYMEMEMPDANRVPSLHFEGVGSDLLDRRGPVRENKTI